MARVISTINSAIIRLIISFSLTLMIVSGAALAQNPYDNGTPVEAKGGASWFSAYAPDKLENVNLANGNYMVNIPLATVGGRGSATYTITLSHNSKVWTSRHDPEVITDPLGGRVVIHHFRPEYGDGMNGIPNEYVLGGGWSIMKSPTIKAKTIFIDPVDVITFPGTFDYILKKLWLALPDGSEIELRDEATQGAPARGAGPGHPLVDRNRGRVWKSVDGTAITFVTDTDTSMSGWVFMPDGTRFRIEGMPGGGALSRCTKIIDRDGNYINITYDTPSADAVTYTDQLGRQVVLQAGMGRATVTIKRYDGLADQVYTVETDRIGAPDGSGNPINMRSDYWSVQRPIIAGDFHHDYFGIILHTYTGPHTDLFDQGENPIIIDDMLVPTKLIMPDGRSFSFRYDIFAQLAEIVYPGGGKTQVDYAGKQSGVCEILRAPFASEVNRNVTQRRVLSDGNTVDAVWLYNYGLISSVQVRQGSSDGPLLTSETHYFMAIDAEYRRCLNPDMDYLAHSSTGTMNMKWENAKVYKVERQTGSGLLIKTKNWAQRAPVVWAPDPGSGVNDYAYRYGQEQPSNDDRVTREDTILEDGKLKRVEHGYDNFNNVTSIKEYDFGTNPNPGPLIRETVRSYATSLNGSCYSNLNPSDPGCGGGIAADINSIIHLRGLMLQQSVWDRTTNQEQVRTLYEYDVYANDGDRAAMLDYASVTGHDPVWSAGRAARGHVTQVGNWLKESNTYIYAYPRYDKVGNVVATKDPRGNVSSVSFADDFGNGDNPGGGVAGNFGATYAFPTLFTSPPPNPGELQHTARAQYNFSSGTQTGFKDRNNIIAKTEYNDPFNRPTKVIAAKGVAGVETHTSFYYAPNNVHGVTLSNNDVMVVKDRDAVGDAILRSWTLTDGFGRTIEDWTRHPQGDVKAATIYDGLGRVIQTSNPHRNGETPIYTTTTYDLAGRATAITTPDGATVNTSYSGNQVTVTDQAGKKRRSKTNALGQLVQVVEDPDGVAHQTDYSYDTLGNLTIVKQGEQYRYFFYDSLGRLTRAKNSEQSANSLLNLANPPAYNNNWSLAYSYDANGNLASKTDARNITTTYDYDAFNRNKTVTYSDSTPVITRTYDTATLGKGRLHKTETAGSTGSRVTINEYDAMGRPLSQSQQFFYLGAWGTSYTKEQSYDLAGAVKTLTYPSDHTVNYSYDLAGRLESFSGDLDGAQRAYADTIRYNSAGQMIKERFGTTTSLYHNLHYNNRQQLVDIRVGDSETDVWNGNRGAFAFFYGTTAVISENQFANSTDNNGNLRRQVAHAPLADGGGVVPQVDDYNYDALNRISLFTESQINSSGQWIPNVASQSFSYDPFGNRKITTASGVGVSNYNPSYNLSTNRINGLDYDAAGNITSDPNSGGTMIYNAENRLLSATKGGGGNYVYNGDGQRVRQITATEGEIWYVYGCDGKLLAEYKANAQPTAPLKEYGYRGGQLLIITERGAGGGVSFVKPASESIVDIGKKADRAVEGAAHGPFVVEEPFAYLEFDEDFGLTTGDVSGDNNTGTHIDGVTGTIAEGRGDAPSANDIGGTLLAKYPAGAQPTTPQKEYHNRSGLSIVTAQSVVSINPTVNQSPVHLGDLGVSSPTPMGHGTTTAWASGSGQTTQRASCQWFGFQPVSGQITRITLKFEWSASGYVSANVQEFSGGDANASALFSVLYSTNNGSSFAWAVSSGESSFISVGGGEYKPFSGGGSFSVDLPANTPINQIFVYDRFYADAWTSDPSLGSAYATVNASIWDIRLEVERDTTPPVISNVAAGSLTPTSATITWNTNENSDSQVEYRTSAGSWQPTTLNPLPVTAHSQGLSGLTPGTHYHYRVRSRDAAGNVATSGEFSFITLGINDAAFVSQSVPATMTAGGSYAVIIRMRNQGTITWAPGQSYRLGSQNPVNNGTWGLGRVELEAGELVPPGAVKTFSFQVVAPSSPGSYNFQWQMVQELVEWFGAKTPNMVVQVVSGPDTTPPTVASVSPAAEAANVFVNEKVIVTFSEPMNTATVNGETVELRDPSNALAPATVSYDPGSFTATLTPTAPLTVGVTYTARVRGGGAALRVKDVAGNALATDMTWTFTTGSVKIKWLVTDHLGSTRMVIGVTGNLADITRHDYAPFGEELSAGVGIRSAALGYGADSTRQKFTGKERDETGLDYFINRYHSSVQGRFTSVDPVFFQKEMLVDPQRFNLYAYTRNNPLRFVDPNGEAIELLGDEEKRKKILAALREIVGKKAGEYLYENEITDKKGNKRYFVGIYKNGPDGKGAAFGAINKVSSRIGNIINDTRIASVNLVEPGTRYTARSPDGSRTETAIVGPLAGNSGRTPGVTDMVSGNITMLDPKYNYGSLPGSVMSNDVADNPSFAIALAHEFGHIQYAWGHSIGLSSNDTAVAFENQVRLLKDPSGPTRKIHHPGDPQHGKGEFRISCPDCAIR